MSRIRVCRGCCLSNSPGKSDYVALNIRSPEPLRSDHSVTAFESGEPSLDDWLKKRALTNQSTGASRTFVACDSERTVFGYYALAAGAVSHSDSISVVRRNMPDPVPVLILARLAVDQRAQGLKLGGALLKDALFRAVQVSQQAGVRALLVHALHDRAKKFYEHYGFQSSPIQPMTLMLRLDKIT